MPTHEAVVDSVIPKQVEKPIPTRTVSTRIGPRPTEIAGQPLINNTSAEESAETTAPEASVRLSAQVSAIARKEQATRLREQALKEREKALEAKLLEADKFGQLKEKISAKDFSEAEALGLTYEEYTKYILDKQGEEDPREARIKALEARLEAKEKSDEESAANQYEETIGEYKKEIGKLVGENPEFSSIKELKREDAVLQLILDAFEADNEELTVNEAARQVEEYLVEYGKRFTSLPKFKQNTEKEMEPARMLPRPQVGRPMVGTTLTNDMTVNSAKRPLKSLQHLSESERYAEARRRVLERREGK